MATTVVVGAQWGDEGKGKIVDLVADSAEVVVRFQGGNNAGHTLVVAGKQRVLHLIPSGVLQPNTVCVMGPGLVIDPGVLVQELNGLKSEGFLDDSQRLKLSERASMIMPYHRALDHLREASAGDGKIGTTGRGIGPAYEDLTGRRSLFIGLLRDPDAFRRALENVLPEKNALIEYYGGEALSADEILETYLSYAPEITPYICNATGYVSEKVHQGAPVLFEGAQGTMLDVLHGTYPYVTSSGTVAGAVCTTMGLGPNTIDRVLAVTKAYATRVGEGPFPTELDGPDGEALREKGGEFGATTGRPRRCGWLDLVALRHAAHLNGATDIALTKLDVLSGMGSLQVCTSYESADGKESDNLLRPTTLGSIKPRYEEVPGWDEDLTGVTSFSALPDTVKAFITKIEAYVGVPVSLVSVGPGREQTIRRGE